MPLQRLPCVALEVPDRLQLLKTSPGSLAISRAVEGDRVRVFRRRSLGMD